MKNITNVRIENNYENDNLIFDNLIEGDYFLHKGHLCVVVVDSETGIIRVCDLQDNEIIDIDGNKIILDIIKSINICCE